MIAEAVLFTIFFCFPVLLLASSGKKEPCMGTGLVLPALAAGALLLLPPPVDAVGAPEGTRPFHHSGDAAKYEKHFFATTTDKKVTNNLFHCSDGIMIRRKKNSDKGSKNNKEWCAQMDDFKFECNYAEAESAGAKADETYFIGSSKNFDDEGKPLHFRHFLDLLGEKKTLRCPIVGDETERGAKNTPHNYPPLARAHVREERERRKERKRENTTHAHACTRPRLPRASPAGFACAYCWLLLCLLLLLRVLSQKAHELENELEAGSLRSLSPLPAPRPSKNNKGSMLYLCNLDSRLEVAFFAFLQLYRIN